MNDKKPCVLVVEDEEGIRLGVEENLKYAGYEVLSAADGPGALVLAREHKPDLMLLDVMLPGLSGYEVARQLREGGHDAGIIMLTARADEFDKLHGFEVGADDYVTKPFSINELLARVKAVLGRGRREGGEHQKFQFDDFVLDTGPRTLMRKGKEVTLTRTEFDLLAYFCKHEGEALSREQVMNDVWGMKYLGTQRSLDSFVAVLRQKVEKDHRRPRHILTVHGVGYKFLR